MAEKDDVPEGFLRGDDGELYPKRVATAICAMALDDNTALAERIEQAMSAAILKALDEGVSIEDAVEMGKRIRAAREQILVELGLT